MISRLFLLPLLGLLAACDALPPAPEPLALLSVTPLTQKSNETKTVRVQLNADPVFHVDYGEPAARQVSTPLLKVGPRAVPLVYLGQGVFEGVLEPLAMGAYPVTVSLDGREATYEKTYAVTLPVRYSYEFESIPPQVRGRPFPVVINVTAYGLVPGEQNPARAASLTIFTGGKDVVSTPVTVYGPGKLQPQYAVINQLGDDFVARIIDSEGEQAYSNAFPVSESPPQQ